MYPGSDTPAVDRLDLEVADGEFLVLVGPSGSGKSTALRMLAGLADVDAGEIRIDEEDVSDAAPKDRDIAMVFQNYALYPHMTVGDNMGFALTLAGRPTPRSPTGCAGRRSCWTWCPTWTASRGRCPAVSVSGSRWGGRSCAPPASS
jgi:ABC-type sugar transport system ATPase subunit